MTSKNNRQNSRNMTIQEISELQDRTLAKLRDKQMRVIKQLKDMGLTWNDIAERVGLESGDIARKRFLRWRDSQARMDASKKNTNSPTTVEEDSVMEIHDENGDIRLTQKIYLSPDVPKTPENILLSLGYDPECWVLKKWVVGRWEVAIHDEAENRICTTIRAHLSPKTIAQFSPEDFAKMAKEAFESIPMFSYKPNKTIKKSEWKEKLMEIPPIELHLGKRAHTDDVPEKYDIDIAGKIFNDIIEDILARQEIEQCEKCLLVIGGDFFNSEFNNETTNGTPIQNDGRFKKVFKAGIQLYSTAIEALADKFDSIDVKLCVGNHSRAMEFFMYIALQQRYFNCANIVFSDCYRDTQAYRYGNNAIFFSHGDANLKRTIKSIPAEFPDVWGETVFRELHLGHLHSEIVVNEEGGMITRRVGSPCATDDWHYTNRFIGSVRKHQIFIWDKETGLSDIVYLNVIPNME